LPSLSLFINESLLPSEAGVAVASKEALNEDQMQALATLHMTPV
jgi:hypothetical protein